MVSAHSLTAVIKLPEMEFSLGRTGSTEKSLTVLLGLRKAGHLMLRSSADHMRV